MSYVPSKVHLVGSVALDSVAEAMRTAMRKPGLVRSILEIPAQSSREPP